MSINVGTVDRVFRVLLRIVLIALPFISGWTMFGATWAVVLSVVLGIVMLATAAMRMCPIYRVLGMNTCRP